VPAYREEMNLATNLQKLMETLGIAQLSYEVVLIVDAAPGDRTREVAMRIASNHPEVRLILREGRQGVGTAIRAGISIASGQIVMPVMGDASESTDDIIAVALKALEGYDIVVGNRFMKKGMIVGYSPLKSCANRLCNLFTRLLFGVPTSDITNAFKAYRLRVVKDLNLTSTGYSIFVELPVKAYLNSTRNLTEIPVGHIATDKKHGLRVFRDGIGYLLCLLGMLFRANNLIIQERRDKHNFSCLVPRDIPKLV